MLRVEQVHVIRHKVLVEGQSMRRVAAEMGLSRNTVKKYLTQAEPVRHEAEPRRKPVRSVVTARIEALLADKRLTNRKQRWTGPRLAEVLADEGHAVSVRTVQRVAQEWRRRRAEVYVPLVYEPGEMAEVDFFEVVYGPETARRKAQLFLMREMHAGWDAAFLYERADQVSFLDGHVRAFELFGGVPQRLVYDNLKPAVARVLVGTERELSERFEALAAHYLFEPCFCRRGEGHDKGGVESRGKTARLRHLTPIPAGTDVGAIEQAMQARLAREAESRAELVTASRKCLLPLPAWDFVAARVAFVPVSSQATVRVESGWYSVPEEWARSRVEAHIGPREVVFVHDGRRVVHPRVRGNERSIWYPHYLKELSRKTQALRQVASVLVEQLGEPYGTLWRRLVALYGALEAARRYRTVLQQVVEEGEEATRRRLTTALRDDEPLLSLLGTSRVVTASALVVPFALQGVEIAGPSVAAYDTLLGGAP
jgi:transposase